MDMEEGHNQPKISTKRMKFEDMMEKGEEDRISALPDCILIEILSRLPSTKEAIRTGALSKRWKPLWTLVHTLIFTLDSSPQNRNSMSDFISLVDKTLTQCFPSKLKKFEVYIRCGILCGSQVNNWIRYAVSRNVEELNLTLWSIMRNEFLLEHSFFISTCFTYLRLPGGCIFNPIGAISWKNLKSLCISCKKLDEILIENILCGSPLLETLVLKSCSGYRRLDVTSKSVKNLVLENYYVYRGLDIIEIKAPYILSLTIEGVLWLKKLLLMNVSALVAANLGYRNFVKTPKEAVEEMLEGLILNLRHAQQLKIGGFCSKVLSRLEAKGFIIPSNMKFSPDVPSAL